MYFESNHLGAMKYKYNNIDKVNMIIKAIFEIK